MSMKIEPTAKDNPCSRPVLTTATGNKPISTPERRELPLTISNGLGSDHTKRHSNHRASMQLTERDKEIVYLVCQMRALCDDQIQTALFTPGARSRCQLRLTLLVRHQYLDRLPRKRVTDPAIYVLSRKSVKGNRLMKERLGEAEFRRQMFRLGSVEHLLAVNDVRVRIDKACRELGYNMRLWQGPEQLSLLLGKAHLVPDAYFQVRRKVDGQERTAAFFLEVERGVKSSQVLRSKLQRYAQLYYGGGYQQLFGTRALRVLVVFSSDSGSTNRRQVEAGVLEAKRIGVSIARFVGLEQLKEVSPVDCLSRSIWHQSGQPEEVALFVLPVHNKE